MVIAACERNRDRAVYSRSLECERLPSTFCEKEKEEETERYSLKTHLLAQDLPAPTSSSPHSESKQGVSHKKDWEKRCPKLPPWRLYPDNRGK